MVQLNFENAFEADRTPYNEFVKDACLSRSEKAILLLFYEETLIDTYAVFDSREVKDALGFSWPTIYMALKELNKRDVIERLNPDFRNTYSPWILTDTFRNFIKVPIRKKELEI